MNDEFDDIFKDFINDEFLVVKSSPEFKRDIITKVQKRSLKGVIKSIWNYNIEIELRICIAAILLIVAIPGIYVFNKAEEIKKNEIKKYESVEYRIK